MNERALKRVINADVLGICLVLLAIEMLLYGVSTAMRDTGSHNLFWICLLAAGLGFYGAKSPWNGRVLSVVIIATGLVTVWIVGARIATPLVDLSRALFASGPQIVPQIRYRFDIDADGIISSWNAIVVSSAALMTRLQTWMLAAAKDLHVNDVLIRNILWMFALWLLSAWMGWFAARRNGMASLLPGVVLLTLLIGSTERRVESLWGLVMIMLLLMGVWNYKNHVQSWETNRIDYSDSIRFDMSQFVLMVAVVVGLISYITPSISWRDIRDYLRERQQPQPTEVVANPSIPTKTAAQPSKHIPQSSLPRQHLLTTGSAQSKEIVMTIKTGELPPVPMQGVTDSVPRYYWRSVVYDQYDGRGWFTTSAPPQSISANQPMIAGVLTGYKSLHLDVQVQQPDGRLYWSGMLYSADVPLAVDWRLRPQSGLFADQTDLLQADMFAARTKATSYTADSLVPIPSIQQLRAAQVDDYPENIQHLYLSLPNTIPERVHRLAKEITEGQATEYDKAKAIETYLRANYPYDLEISAPPEDQDVADYFLFDLKRGYCDYYATAMVVLARSSGIPARFVSGYASGDYDVSSAQYVVRELHAHSWAEIYFSGIGWVEFEPTDNQPEIQRKETNESTKGNDDESSNPHGVFGTWTSWDLSKVFIPLAIVFLVALTYFAFVEPFFFMRMTPAAAIEVLYRRLYRSGRPLAGEVVRAETASEFTNKLIQKIREINTDLKRTSHHLQKDATDLTAIYQAVLFSDHHIEHEHVKHALMLWNRLRWSLMHERIKYFFWKHNKSSQ